MKYLIAILALCLVSQASIRYTTAISKKERCEKKAVLKCSEEDLTDEQLKKCHKTEADKCMKEMEAKYEE
jgi:hypothetical protein